MSAAALREGARRDVPIERVAASRPRAPAAHARPHPERVDLRPDPSGHSTPADVGGGLGRLHAARRSIIKSRDAGNAGAAIPIAALSKLYGIERLLVEERGRRDLALVKPRSERARPV